MPASYTNSAPRRKRTVINMNITLPYGKDNVDFRVPDESFTEMLDPEAAAPVFSASSEIIRAIDNPLGTPPLEDVIGNMPENKKICVIIDDISRPTPVSTILPILIQKLLNAGVRRENVKIVTALGSHRYMSDRELSERVGLDIYRQYSVSNSEFRRPGDLVFVGEAPDGVKITASKSVMDSDIRIGIGNLAPHPVMGWSGGGKILFPGVSGEDTVAYFHLKASLIEDNMFGWQTTPIRKMIEGWVDIIGLHFIINTVLTPALEMYKTLAGHYAEAYRAGVEEAKKIVGHRIKEKADVVIVGSHPADQDFWQSPKGMYAAEPVLRGKHGGTIILVSPNSEGIGPHTEFPEYMGRDDGDEVVRACIGGGKGFGDALAIALGNSMSKMRRRRKLVVVSDGVTAAEMAKCGCMHYPKAMLQRAVDEAIAEYDNCRVAAMSNGAETVLYE